MSKFITEKFPLPDKTHKVCGHPLLARSSVCLSDLAGESFVSLSPGSSLYRILSYYFADRNFQPDITTYIDNPDIMRKLLAAQAGLAFVPALTWRGLSSNGIRMRQVEDLPMTCQ